MKGGALAYTLSGEESRHTRDIDFLLTQLKAEKNNLHAIFAEIAEIDGDDGVIFKAGSIKAESITKEGNYDGTRIKIEVRLGRIKQWIQIDIGVGDFVTPGPQEIIYPVILNDLNAPKLIAYSVETLVAEKFHAMIDLGVFNSRLKDFYDIYKFVELCDEQILRDAIFNTFRTRKTRKVVEHPLFDDSFYDDKDRNKQWLLFLQKNQLGQISFNQVKPKILDILRPIYLELS